ncbi:Retrotransposon gag domain [Dillenia turbinata]|uniref:Retrotransposon gag domain n=1 Tax=Dillenia turbinata TaxID=194707 RepID=A0AAN8Z5R6_9MAGN
MKKELKRRFLPDNYRQDNFLKLHNLRQIDLSVEEYTIEFELLLLKYDVVEPEEETIAHYLGGLNEEIGNAIRLPPYYSFNDVRKLPFHLQNPSPRLHLILVVVSNLLIQILVPENALNVKGMGILL